MKTLSTNQGFSQKKQTIVSPAIAESVALNFTKRGPFFSSAKKENTLKTVKVSPTKGYQKKDIDKIVTFKSANNKPAFYVIKFKPNGFVIVSASKKEMPVLAYSNHNTFDEKSIKGGVSLWISRKKKQIRYLESDSTYSSPTSVKEAWNGMAPPPGDGGGTNPTPSNKYQQIGPLLHTAWGQDEPYNDEVPYMACSPFFNTNGRALVGCDAVATAQVIRYWEYPTTWFNWSIMDSTEYSWDTTAATRNKPSVIEVAKLMKYVGIGIDETYGCDNSTSNLGNDRNGLVNYFGYSNDAEEVAYDHITPAYAGTYVIPQMQEGRPIIMRGDNGGGEGHAWVCDGCQIQLDYTVNYIGGLNIPDTVWSVSNNCGYLSMNWGWNGSYNGWYEYDNLIPRQYLDDFNYDNYMIINIHP